MPGSRREKRARATPMPPPDGRAASARGAAPDAEDGAPRGAPRPDETGDGERRGRARRGAPKKPEVALRDLLRGLHAGDLDCVLLTVAMAAEENRMPSTDLDEAARILGFLARLAEHDAGLPPRPDGAGAAPDVPLRRD